MMLPSRIETRRLLLRSVEAGDADALSAIYRDEETMRFIGGPRTFRQACDEIAETVAASELLGLGMRVLVRRDDQALIGRAGLTPLPAAGFDLGYLLARHAWGAGYATEAVIALRDAASAAGLLPITCKIARANAASIRVAERAGMQPRPPGAEPPLCCGEPAVIYVWPQPAGL